MSKVKCPNCGAEIDVDDILAKDVKAQVIAEEHAKHELDLEKVKKQAEETANQQLQSRLELVEQKKNQELDLEREKIKAEFEGKSKKELQERELAMKQLTNDAETEKADNKKLREQLSEMMDQLREEKKSRENVELEAKKKLSEEEDKIREEAKKKADEEHRLKNLEMEKKLRDTQEALATAQRKAEQGSQQNQGEVLELDLEESLRQEFPLDEIKEVKKGVRGADVTQIVKNNHLEQCGIMLYESKNAAWQPKWIAKFKEDIREAGASIGVLVSKEIPADYGEMKNIEGIWVVKPKLVLALASAMRNQIISVWTANHNNENKDEKMEILYQFLTGTEFRHRVEGIVENYSTLQNDLEQEYRLATNRFHKRQKMLRGVIDNTIGMYGDLQGITGGAMSEIKQLEEPEEE
ncbi:DUF2130 domain-containing protein [Lactococcus lactis]|uniref:DUF2130 domain-containing protein n=1 Tax=Lactococcus lactis TaxID=1358 RepID=UPI00288DD4CF|nr:DUF2130 domain-containing protein [Lactococcus lactis]MDT2897170.1 DUF2130 domain-containing protein [Lactococcus lactis]MDT2948208.1 DUF2130 domain-containing protein [Lactococcus lactis]MDT2969403.1 DUF2130 domain-containing protein [Lactococcus lactis]